MQASTEDTKSTKVSFSGLRALGGRDFQGGFRKPLAAFGIQPLDLALVLLLGALSLALYVRTVAPGLLDGDEGEFQVNIFRLGVSHTGYPLFFLLGKLWTILLPIGTIATRANLFSVFWGVLAVVAIFGVVRFLTHNSWAGAICALLLAASRVEWSQAVIPRVYTLNSLFVVVVMLLFFLWRIGRVDLTVPVFAYGLSLTNHRTIMWFGPAIAVFVLWHERAKLFQPRRLVTLAIAFVLPLLLYAYVFWRGESDVGVEFHWKDFNDEILGGYVRASWRFGPVGWLVSRITDLYIPMLIEQFTLFGFIAGLVGLGALALDRPPRGWPRALPPREVLLFVLLANLANTAFCVIFWVIDIDKFFLPSFITFLLLTGVGIAVLWDAYASQPLRALARAVVALAFVFATGFLVVSNLPLNDWSHRTDIARAWDENLAQALEPNAVIAGSWESITPLEYMMYVDGRRRDLERWKLIVKEYQLGQVPYGSRQEDVERAVRAGRPVYLTVYPGETETLGALVDEFTLTRVGDLWRVVNAPPAGLPATESIKSGPPIAAFSDREGRTIELLDYVVGPGTPLRAGEFAWVTLYWRAPESLRTRLGVSLRVLDSRGHLLLQRDSEPASGRRPTTGWLANEVVQDDAGLIIPLDTPPGSLQLLLIVYNSATGESLKVSEGSSHTLGTLDLAPAAEPPPWEVLNIPHRMDSPFGSLRLRGYGLSTTSPKGGDKLDLSLWWQAAPSAQDDEITLSLRDNSGRNFKAYTGAPIDGYSAGAWGADRILRGRYSIPLPIDWTGAARLVVESGGREVNLVPLEIQASGRTFEAPVIPRPQSAQLGDSIRLLGYDLDKTRARPGESVRLTLYWRAVRRPPASYTVFTHALDPQGIVRGQKDSIPRGGELPTDRWLPDEVVVDPYTIEFPRDAPPGNYQLEVGMYLAETGVRVAVVDASGVQQPDNRILLDTPLEIR